MLERTLKGFLFAFFIYLTIIVTRWFDGRYDGRKEIFS